MLADQQPGTCPSCRARLATRAARNLTDMNTCHLQIMPAGMPVRPSVLSPSSSDAAAVAAADFPWLHPLARSLPGSARGSILAGGTVAAASNSSSGILSPFSNFMAGKMTATVQPLPGPPAADASLLIHHPVAGLNAAQHSFYANSAAAGGGLLHGGTAGCMGAGARLSASPHFILQVRKLSVMLQQAVCCHNCDACAMH